MKPDRSTLIQESIHLLQAIAPELDADTLAPERPLRQQLVDRSINTVTK